jgi:hypothetical protein
MQKMAPAPQLYPVTFYYDGSEGGNDFEVRSVDVVFAGSTTKVKVSIPNQLRSGPLTRLRFTVQKGDCVADKDQLKLRSQQFSIISLKMKIFPINQVESAISMKMNMRSPELLDPNKRYSIYLKHLQDLFYIADIREEGEMLRTGKLGLA